MSAGRPPTNPSSDPSVPDPGLGTSPVRGTALAFVGVVAVSGITALDVSIADVSLGVLTVPIVAAVAWLSTWAGIVTAVVATAGAFSASMTVGAEGLDSVLATGGALHAVLIAVAVGLPWIRRAVAESQRAAVVDPLTGVLNQRGFEMIAERERIRAGRTRKPISVAYLELDDFGSINERHSRARGDRALAALAAAVATSVRGSDVFARLAGDDFALLLPDTDARGALVVVDRLRRTLAKSGPEGASLTASIGIATFRYPPDDVEALVLGAQDLMYEAKDRGGDTVVSQVVVGRIAHWAEPVAEELRAASSE